MAIVTGKTVHCDAARPLQTQRSAALRRMLVDMPSLAPRMADLGTETAFDVLARTRVLEAQGRRILHVELGEPNFTANYKMRKTRTYTLKNRAAKERTVILEHPIHEGAPTPSTSSFSVIPGVRVTSVHSASYYQTVNEPGDCDDRELQPFGRLP